MASAPSFHQFFNLSAIDFTEVDRLHLGLRLVRINGELLRIIQMQGNYAEFWRELFSRLPKDAKIVRLFDTHVLIKNFTGCGYSDEFVVCIGSREFSLVKSGELIPYFDIFPNSENKLTIYEKQKWYLKPYLWLAERAIRKFPNWIKY